MSTSVVPAELIPIIYLGVIFGISGLVFKWYLGYRVSNAKQQATDYRAATKPENQIGSLLDNLPQIKADRIALYEKAVIEAGPESKLASSLKNQIEWIEKIEQIPQPVLDMAKPLLGKVYGMVMKVVGGNFKL